MAFATVGMTLALTAHAASFDCTKARSFSEKAVCGDAQLSTQDDRLGQVYKAAYAATPDKRALAAVRDHEWRWRQTHCHDAACVTSWYARRIAELEADCGDHCEATQALDKPRRIKPPAALLQAQLKTAEMQKKTSKAVTATAKLTPTTPPLTAGTSADIPPPLPPTFSGAPHQAGPLVLPDSPLAVLDRPGTSMVSSASTPSLPSMTWSSPANPEDIRILKNLGHPGTRTVGVFVAF